MARGLHDHGLLAYLCSHGDTSVREDSWKPIKLFQRMLATYVDYMEIG